MPRYEAICYRGGIGRHPGLKILYPEMGVRVRVPRVAPNIGRVEMEKMPAGLTLARKGYG